MRSRVYDKQDDEQILPSGPRPRRSDGDGHEAEHPSRWATVCSIAAKIGCSAHTLNEWMKKAEIDTGKQGPIWGNAGKGRPKGSANKTTAVLRDAILKAAENAGDGNLTAYLTECANAVRRSFLTLLAKVLPTQVDGKFQHDLMSHEEALAELE